MLLTPYITTRKLFQHTDLLSGLSGFIKEAELVKVIHQRALANQVEGKIWSDDETDLFQ